MRLDLFSTSVPFPLELFYSFFKSLVGKDVVVELKNDLSICGTLHSVEQMLVRQIPRSILICSLQMKWISNCCRILHASRPCSRSNDSLRQGCGSGLVFFPLSHKGS